MWFTMLSVILKLTRYSLRDLIWFCSSWFVFVEIEILVSIAESFASLFFSEDLSAAIEDFNSEIFCLSEAFCDCKEESFDFKFWLDFSSMKFVLQFLSFSSRSLSSQYYFSSFSFNWRLRQSLCSIWFCFVTDMI